MGGEETEGSGGTDAAMSYLDPVPVRDQRKGAPFPKRRHSGSLGLNLSARFGTDPPNSSRGPSFHRQSSLLQDSRVPLCLPEKHQANL